MELLEKLKNEKSELRQEIPIIYETAIKLNAQKIIDLGVARYARSARAFLLACSKTGGRVWSVDIKDYGTPKQLIKGWGLSHMWTFTAMDSLDAFYWIALKWGDDVDIVMIDTQHTYEQTMAELKLYSQLIRVGGMILLHDTATSGFRDIVYGVRRAILEFSEIEKDKWEYYEYGTHFGFAHLKRLK